MKLEPYHQVQIRVIYRIHLLWDRLLLLCMAYSRPLLSQTNCVISFGILVFTGFDFVQQNQIGQNIWQGGCNAPILEERHN